MKWLKATVVVVAIAFGACAEDEAPTVADPVESPAATETAGAAASPSPGGAAAVRTESHPQHGTILVDAQGRTLYTFDRDEGGQVACTGDCATRWPPVLSANRQATSGVTGLGVVQRPEGTTQVTYQNKPLYRYSEDTKAGDVKGDGVGGVWHVAKVSS